MAQLGITHQRITPGCPQENGAHERLHKILKARATRPPAANLNTQQRVFNAFQHTYNELQPHEALDDETPASRWVPSPRSYPERIARRNIPATLKCAASAAPARSACTPANTS